MFCCPDPDGPSDFGLDSKVADSGSQISGSLLFQRTSLKNGSQKITFKNSAGLGLAALHDAPILANP